MTIKTKQTVYTLLDQTLFAAILKPKTIFGMDAIVFRQSDSKSIL